MLRLFSSSRLSGLSEMVPPSLFFVVDFFSHAVADVCLKEYPAVEMPLQKLTRMCVMTFFLTFSLLFCFFSEARQVILGHVRFLPVQPFSSMYEQ